VDTSSAIRRAAPGTPHRPAPEMSPSAAGTAPGAGSAGTGAGLVLLGAAILAGATVLAQISYPLLSGGPLRISTITTVLLFAAASLAHAAATHGRGPALRLLAVAGGVGLLAEAMGVATGIPFGDYAYTGTLGPAVLGVPILVPLAWTMMAYPCLLLGRRLVRTVPAGARRRAVAVGLGAWTLAAWDLYLDPQMVAAGHWSWRDPSPALPGVPGIPLSNYAGWVMVAVAITATLDRALPEPDHVRAEAVPASLLAWTWLGSALGNLVFFNRPAVAGYGVLAMGVATLPYLRQVTGGRVIGGRSRGGRR
jgi:uncharacterized membrane protein